MNAALFTKSTTGLILASSLIAASSVFAHANDAPVALGTAATALLSGSYSTVPTGQAMLGGHTFDMTSGTLLKLANNQSASFAGSYQNPKAVHLLLNTANTSNMFLGSTVGNIVLTFSDTTTQTASLTVGGNVREWCISAFGVVNTVTDITPNPAVPGTPYVTQGVWTTTPVGGTGTAVLDMVPVPVVPANATKTLTSVQLIDVNAFGSIQIDLAGLTVEFTPPAPPTPTPTPTPTPPPTPTSTGDETGNHNGDHHNTDRKATAPKKAVNTETNAQNSKQDDGGNRGHRDAN